MGNRAFKQLTERDRVLISYLKNRGLSLSEIARRIGKNKSTISRELRRNAQVVTKEDHLFWLKIQNLWLDKDLERYLAGLPDAQRMGLVQTRLDWSARDAQAVPTIRPSSMGGRRSKAPQEPLARCTPRR